MAQTLDQPLFTLSEVTDVIGMPYGVEMTINDGFYVTVLSYLVIRTALRAVTAVFYERAEGVIEERVKARLRDESDEHRR